MEHRELSSVQRQQIHNQILRLVELCKIIYKIDYPQKIYWCGNSNLKYQICRFKTLIENNESEPGTSGLEKTAPSGGLKIFLDQSRKELVISYCFSSLI